MKRFLIASLVLITLSLVIRWQAPGVIHKQLARQLEKHGAELQCLNWHIASFHRIIVEELCLAYKGIEAEVTGVEISLMQAAFWQNRFNWKNLVPAIKAEQLKILLPGNIPTQTSEPPPANESTSSLPDFWLPDVTIALVTLQSHAAVDVAKLDFNFNLSQQKQQRTLHLRTVNSPSNASLSVIQQQQNLQIEWDIDLNWLDTSVRTWLPILSVDVEPFSAMSFLSGNVSGKLQLDVSNPEVFESQHSINALKAQFTHEALEEVVILESEQQFELNSKNDVITANFAQNGTTSLSDFDAIAESLLKNYQWQGIDFKLQSVDFPEQSTLQISLPSALSIRLNNKQNSIASVYMDSVAASNTRQDIRFSQPEWDAKTSEVSTGFELHNTVFLNKTANHQQASKSNQLSMHLQGQLKTDLSSGKVSLEQFSVSGVGLGSGNDSVLDIPAEMSWFDTELNGTGILQWQEKNWNIDADYQAKLTSLEAGPFSFDEIVGKGKLALSNDQLSSSQAVILSPEIALQVNTGGNAQQLDVNVILADTRLNSFTSLAQQIDPNVSLTEGTINSTASSTIQDGQLQTATVILDINNGAGSWQDYHFSGLNTALPLTLNQSLYIAAQPKQLQIEQLHAGATISNIDSRFLISGSVSQPRLQLEQLSGDVFQGSFVLQQLNYPFTANSKSLLTINQLQLNQLVNLFGEQGIQLTGSISGDIPLSFSEGLVSVEQAIVKADSEGKLSIQDNEAFQNLKNSQETLGIALTLLEELNYTTLQSEVHLEPDGWMTLAVNIAGVNPKRAQPVNFNPTLTTNLFTGLKALRAGQNVADKIEHQLQR